jgi:hypothetical protein
MTTVDWTQGTEIVSADEVRAWLGRSATDTLRRSSIAALVIEP